MDERKIALRNGKFGYFAIAMTLVINLILASSIFFDIDLGKTRELFLSLATLMTLAYAVTFPTKLLPSGMYLLRSVIFVILPHVIVQLISTQGTGGIAIAGYVIGMIISLFCAYIGIGYQRKVLKYISEENYNDYALFEYKTFKVQEINIYSLAFLLINFFIMLTAGTDVPLIIVLYINMFVAFTLNFYRTRAAASDKVKMLHYVLESVCTLLAFTLVVVVHALELSEFIFIGALALLVPTIAVTILIYKSLDNFMYH